MKVLVTGGGGFLGRSLVNKLLNLGHTVRLISRSPMDAPNKNLEVIVGDLTSEQLDFIDLALGCDVIFNCAGELADESKMELLHVDATKRLLRAVVTSSQIDGNKKHWVQLSSVGAYGALRSSRRLIIDEFSGLHPQNKYERTKAAADELIINLCKISTVTFSILRPSNIVGSSMKNQSFAALLNAIKQKKFFFIGSRESLSTYIHVDDVVDALILCGTVPEAKNQIFNLSNDCQLAEIVSVVANSSGISSDFFCIPERPLRLSVWFLSKFMRLPLTASRIDSLVSRTTYPSSKIRNTLGFSPSRSIPVFAAEYSKLIK